MKKKDLTELLNQWQAGDDAALEVVAEQVFNDLEAKARARLKAHRPLDTGDLLNEAFLKILAVKNITFEDRGHFYHLAAKAMQEVLIDHFRRSTTQKRGQPLQLEQEILSPLGCPGTLLEVNTALDDLKTVDGAAYTVVQYRVFLGLSFEEIGGLQKRGRSSVHRDWVFARHFLSDRLR